MSRFTVRVGKWVLIWHTIPRGDQGRACVEISEASWAAQSQAGSSPVVEVSWRRDADGLWLILPDSVQGFDLQSKQDEEGRLLFHLSRRMSTQQWSQVPFSYRDFQNAASHGGARKKLSPVRAQMPGKILKILVHPGQEVSHHQPLLLMEAMKMENEIKSPRSGKIQSVKVSEGQAVESGAELVVFES
ncbi:MAG: acetyl-CoA carboxylase biotin carboxyl carrier protein subunit [Bdellovibrionia bacterium]